MSQQVWNASLYDQKHAFVFAYGEDLLGLLAAQPGERILDLGCGTGHLTAQLAQSGATVIGLDYSPQMIEVARQTYPQLEFVLGDASDFQLAEPFDAVFSNAALHWVTRAEDAARCIARALKPGGRFVAEFGGKGNVAHVSAAVSQAIREQTGQHLPHKWYFPAVGEYASVLEAAGFEVQFAHLFDRPTKLEGDDGMRNWLEMFAGSWLASLAEEIRQNVLQRAVELLRATQWQDGQWFADYRRLRVVAKKLRD